MNENINLCEILKDCPKGTKFCSYIHGEVEFIKVDTSPNLRCPIWVMTFPKLGGAGVPGSFTKEGYNDEYYNNEKCILVPSFEQPDWSKWKCPKPKKPKFDPKTLKAFDKVLIRFSEIDEWACSIFSHRIETDFVLRFKAVESISAKYCIPYNDETKHLVGTKGEAPEYYRYWED